MSYTTVEAGAFEIAISHARGCYQRALIGGSEAWSGATLQGKAATYASHYERSRRGLMSRLRADRRLVVEEYRGAHNKRLVSIGLALHMRHDEGPQPERACGVHADCIVSTALAAACAEGVAA